MSNLLNLSVNPVAADASLFPPALHGAHVGFTFKSKVGAKDGDYLTFHQFPPGKKSPSESDCRALNGVFLDFDMKDWLANTQTGNVKDGATITAEMHALSDEDLQVQLNTYFDVVCDALNVALPGVTPNVIVCTGYGYHVHYWYAQPVALLNSKVLAAQKSYVSTLCEIITETAGYALADKSSSAINKYARVPGTFNLKNEKMPRPVHIVHYAPDATRLKTIDTALTANRVALAKARAEAAKRSVKVNANIIAATPSLGGAIASGPSGEFTGDLSTLDIKTLFHRDGKYIGPKPPTTAEEMELFQKTPVSEIKHFVVCPFHDVTPGHDKKGNEGNAWIKEGDPDLLPKPAIARFYCHWCVAHEPYKDAKREDGSPMSPIVALTFGVLNKHFGAETAHRYCKPSGRNFTPLKRGAPLSLKSISQLQHVFMNEMPYAMDNGLAYAQNSFYAFNRARFFWEKLSDDRIMVDLQRFDGIKFMNNQGQPCPWPLSMSDYQGVMSLLRSNAKMNPASARLSGNTQGLLFNNGFLHADGQFETDPEEIKVLGAIKPQLTDCDWIPENEAGTLEEECPNFVKYLTETLDDDYAFEGKEEGLKRDPRREVLMQVPGVALLGCGTKLGKALVIRGVSNTGKSTYCNIMQSLFQPEAFCSVHPQDFSTAFGLAPMAGARMNFVDDMKHTEMKDPSKWKSVIRGEVVTINEKFEKAFKYYPIAGHLYGTNHPLRANIADTGVLARITEIEFKNVKPEHLQDKGLFRRITSPDGGERDNLLRHCVYMGLKVLAKKNCALTALPNEQERRLEAEEEADLVLSFIKNECVRIEPVAGQVCGYTGVDFFQRFMRYCVMCNRPTTINANDFGRRAKLILGDTGWRRFESGIRYFVQTSFEPHIGPRY